MIKGLQALKVLVMSSTTIFNTKEQIDESVKTIEKELKALEIISKAYGDYANHRISEYELIMIVGENTTY